MRRAGRLRGSELFAYKQQTRLTVSRSVGAQSARERARARFAFVLADRIDCLAVNALMRRQDRRGRRRWRACAMLRDAQPACLYSIGWMGERCARVHSSRRTPLNSANLPRTMNSPYVQDCRADGPRRSAIQQM